jgi:hypothetical protein
MRKNLQNTAQVLAQCLAGFAYKLIKGIFKSQAHPQFHYPQVFWHELEPY